jgi:hypothetical protein
VVNTRNWKKTVSTAPDTLRILIKDHLLLAVTSVFLLAVIALALVPVSSINLYYKINLSQDVPVSQVATFTFDSNADFPSSSIQQADIRYTPAPSATLRIDPLNKSSKTLSIQVPGKSTTIRSFDTVVELDGKTLYRVSHLQGADLAKVQEGTSTRYSLSTQQLRQIQMEANRKSETKIFILAIFVLAYAIVVLRLTILSKLNIKFFAAGTVISLLILGFAANTVFIRQPVLIHQPVSVSSSAEISQSRGFSITQKLIPTDDIENLSLPITIPDNIKPTDTSSPEYKTVYASASRFVDQYTITVTQEGSSTPLYKSLIVPSMLDSEATTITIPLRTDNTSSPISIVLSKSAESIEPTLRFKSYSDSSRTNYSPGKSTGLANQSTMYLNVMPGYQGFNYRLAILAVLAVFLFALIINLLAGGNRFLRLKKPLCAINYGGLIAYAFAQFLVYARYIQGFPDEQAHLSYIAFLKQQGGLSLIPHFESMQRYAMDATDQTMNLSQGLGFNYLGHPPLYYQIMRFVGGITINGNIASYDLQRLRLSSFCIGLVGIAVLFYIGFSRIPKIPLLHLLFGLIIISPPNLIFVMSGLNNDTLCLLTASIFLMGAIRFIEKRYNFLTFFLIATGVTTSLLTKLTTGIMVGTGALLMLVYFLWREKGFHKLLKANFLLTLPIYALVPSYFLLLWSKYHTVQPSYQAFAYSEYVHTVFYIPLDARGEMGVWEFISNFFTSFLDTWVTPSGEIAFPRNMSLPFYSIDRIAVIMTLLLPFAIFFIKGNNRAKAYMRCMLLGVVFAFIIQMRGVYSSTMDIGRFAAYSSRYYLCVIGLFAMAIMWIVMKLFMKHDDQLVQGTRSRQEIYYSVLDQDDKIGNNRLTELGVLICASFCILLVFDGFIYSVLCQATGLSGFTQ